MLKLYKKHGDALKPSDYKKTTAGINKDSINSFRITSVINYAADDFSSEENPFKYRLDADSPGGVKRTIENDNGWGINRGDDADFGNCFYYRYKFEWINAIIQLIAVIIVYIAMSYKCVRVAFELVTARLIAFLYSAELSGGEKIRKILCFIRDSYILLGITAICIKLYAVFTGFIHTGVGTSLTAAIFSLFLAFSVIDGPNLVEKLLGMDAGLKSSTARMMALGGMMFGVSRGAARATNNVFGKGRQIGRQNAKASHFQSSEAPDGKDKDMDKSRSYKNDGGGISPDTKRDNKSSGTDKNVKSFGGDKNHNKNAGNADELTKEKAFDKNIDFMEKNMGSKNNQIFDDPASRIDKSSGRNKRTSFSQTDKSESSMPKRSIGTKSRYTSKGRRDK